MTINPSWKPGQRIAFRFFFLFLSASTAVCWLLIVYIAASFFKSRPFDITSTFAFLSRPFYWLDKHLYHTGYDPAALGNYPGDNRFGIIFYVTLLIIAVLVTIVWSILDKHRPGYGRLFYWFNVYLRYLLSLVLFGYGIDKLIPIQMPYPGVVDLLTPLGEQERFTALWNFMGISPGFQMFTGAFEIIGSLMLLFRRTAVAGYLFLLIILTNVVAFNFFYNIPVKLFSSSLLLDVLFLLAPYFYRLIQLFFNQQPVALTEIRYTFQTRWKKYALISGLIIIPLFIFSTTTITDLRRYNKSRAQAQRERVYDVTSFVTKDTVPALLTDTLRWKRLLFANSNNAIVYNMKDEKSWFACDADSIKKTFTLHVDGDTIIKHIFNYTYLEKDQLLLTGNWKGNNVTIRLKSNPIDSLPLNKEKVRVIWE